MRYLMISNGIIQNRFIGNLKMKIFENLDLRDLENEVWKNVEIFSRLSN